MEIIILRVGAIVIPLPAMNDDLIPRRTVFLLVPGTIALLVVSPAERMVPVHSSLPPSHAAAIPAALSATANVHHEEGKQDDMTPKHPKNWNGRPMHPPVKFSKM